MKKATRQKLIFGLVTTLVLSLIFAYGITNNRLNSWNQKLSNFLYYTPENEASEDIVIVAIDNKSFEFKNASELGTLKFNKADYAQAFNNLEDAGAKVIGVDIIFSEVSSKEDQAELVETLENNDDIILAAEPEAKGTFGLKPLDVFVEAAPNNLASILFRPDSDNTVRRQQLLFEDPLSPESFALKISKTYLGLLPEDSKKTDTGYSVMDFAVRVGSKKFNPINIPLAEDGTLLVNFFASPNSFQTISFIDAYNNEMTERKTQEELDLNNKIVLIGEVGTGIHDVQYVPNSFGTPMPGIEIHANLIQTILSQSFIVPQSKGNLTMVTALMVAASFLIFLSVRILISLILLILAIVAYTFVTYTAFELGTVLNMVYPYLALIISFIAAYVFRYFIEARGAQKTQRAFSRYVSPDVVKKIIDNPDQLKLGGEKKELTVYFSDIAGFTSIAESMKAEELVEELNEYLDAMSEIILEKEGTVDKFIGDAIVAFWGAPVPVKNHAERACLAALECQAKLEKLRKIWKEKGKPEIHSRIGLNTGPVIVGNMGSNKRFDYTAIGDNMNLGARLESAGKYYGTDILISESTYKAAKNVIEAREIDVITVKGKTKPVKVYELLAKKGKLDDKTKKAVSHFAKGLAAYRKQKWAEAEKAFKAAGDAPSKAYLERIKELKKAKLPKSWDGVYKLTKK